MPKLYKNFTTVVVVTVLLLLLLTGLLLPPSEQQQLPFTPAGAGELECIDYDEGENNITVSCNASFLDVVQTINDPAILENLGNGEYLLNASLEVDDGVTFEMTSSNGEIYNTSRLQVKME